MPISRRLAIILITAIAAGIIALVPTLVLPTSPMDHAEHIAHSQSMDIPTPFPACDSTSVPFGQANPPGEPEPMEAIWCFPLNPGPTSRVSGANDWVDEFHTNIQMQTLGAVNSPVGNNRQDESTGSDYRIFNNLTTGGSGGALKSQGFINNNHWMFDEAGAHIEGGTLMSPNRSFHWENGKLVVEADFASGMADYGGADQFGEIDINTSPTVTVGKNPTSLGINCGNNIEHFGQFAGTCKSPDPLYGYGQFPGNWSLGCRLEAQGNPICSLYNPDGASVTSTNHPTGLGRVWEISPIESGSDIGTLQSTPGILGGQQLWRRCLPGQMDMFCRDRFRIELTRTTLTLFVNGQLYFEFGVLPGHTVPGVPQAGQLVPDALINGPDYAYFTTWVSAFNTEPSVRFHWGRLAINPHNPDGSPVGPSAAPSYCAGMPQNTCGMGGGTMPTSTPMPPVNGATSTPTPGAPGVATSPVPTNTPTPVSVNPPGPPAGSTNPSPPSSSGGGGGGGGGSHGGSKSTAPQDIGSSGGGGAGSGGGSPVFAALPPIPTPTPQQTTDSSLLNAFVTTDGAALTSGRLALLVPSGMVGASGAQFTLSATAPGSAPALNGALQAGDLAVDVSLTDASSGLPIATYAPPMTLTYTPSDAELAAANGDLQRIALAISNDTGWEPLSCSVTGTSLTCSLSHPGSLVSVSSPSPTSPADFDLPNGHFFTERNGFGGTPGLGFTVVDDSDAALWSEFQRLGGVDVLGYPTSRRFTYGGFLVQTFEYGVLQWQPDSHEAVLLNTLDELTAAGDDPWLSVSQHIPPQPDWSGDQGLSPEDMFSRHRALLDAYPDLKQSLPSRMLDLYGLPTAVQQYGPIVVVRFQRGTLQYWTSDGVAAKNTMLFDSGARLAKQLGFWPSNAMTPEVMPVTSPTG